MADKVKMTKDGETIEVNPLVVEDHQRLGWKVVDEDSTTGAGDESTVTVKAKKARARGRKKKDESESGDESDAGEAGE